MPKRMPNIVNIAFLGLDFGSLSSSLGVQFCMTVSGLKVGLFDESDEWGKWPYRDGSKRLLN